jgi:hypothetical protein
MVRRYQHAGVLGLASVAPFSIDRIRLDPAPPVNDFCREVAAIFDRAPRLAMDEHLKEGYEALRRQSLELYESIVEGGIRIEPWKGPCQPYRSSAELREQVRQTGVLRLYLTRDGHGPAGSTGWHPLREPAGITAGGVELTHNDVFRVVHDVFGHVVVDNSFGPRGELQATRLHMHMYPPMSHPVLFTEQIGQICWFFYGPHLRDARGELIASGEAGYQPAAVRPYPEQKVFAFPQRLLDAFRGLFDAEQESR